jgi:hypothetical protein
VRLVRIFVVVCALALLLAEHAGAQTSSDFTGHHTQIFRVVVVDDLTTSDLPQLSHYGAVGLVVPNAGPSTSAADAFAGMVRGILYNTRLAWPRRCSSWGCSFRTRARARARAPRSRGWCAGSSTTRGYRGRATAC